MYGFRVSFVLYSSKTLLSLGIFPLIICFRGSMENGIWSEWSPWSACFGNCQLRVQARWRYCHHHSKQLVGYLRCVGQPIEIRNCMKPPYTSPSIYPGGRKTHFTKPDGDKLHKQMDVELSEESVKGGPSKSDENNPDFHVHYIQCRPGKDCQKLRAQCLKAGQGRAKVNVSRNEDKIETASSKTGFQGSMKDSKEGAQLNKTIVETPELFHPSTNVERNKPSIEDGSCDNNWTDGGIMQDAADTFSSEYKADVNKTDESASKSEPKKEECDVNIGNLNNQSIGVDIRQSTFSSEYVRIKVDVNETDESASKSEPNKEECDVNIGNLNNQSIGVDIRQSTFSSEYIRIKADVNETDESASKSEPNKEECDVNIGNLNNQSIGVDIRQPKDEKIININKALFGLNDQTTVPPQSGGKRSKLLTLLIRSMKAPKLYSTKAKEYRHGTSNQAPTSIITAAKVITSAPRKLPENQMSKYCKLE